MLSQKLHIKIFNTGSGRTSSNILFWCLLSYHYSGRQLIIKRLHNSFSDMSTDHDHRSNVQPNISSLVVAIGTIKISRVSIWSSMPIRMQKQHIALTNCLEMQERIIYGTETGTEMSSMCFQTVYYQITLQIDESITVSKKRPNFRSFDWKWLGPNSLESRTWILPAEPKYLHRAGTSAPL